MVLGKSLFTSRYWLAITLSYFLEESLFPWGNHLFLVNNDWGSYFSLVYYDWRNYITATPESKDAKKVVLLQVFRKESTQ